jgi:small subunit ribosomal protein S17
MEKRNLRKERIGVVSSNKMEKSIVVSEVKKVKHPMYGKFVSSTKKICCTRWEKWLQYWWYC